GGDPSCSRSGQSALYSSTAAPVPSERSCSPTRCITSSSASTLLCRGSGKPTLLSASSQCPYFWDTCTGKGSGSDRPTQGTKPVRSRGDDVVTEQPGESVNRATKVSHEAKALSEAQLSRTHPSDIPPLTHEIAATLDSLKQV